METRVKERLIGAVVLAALIVIVVPELLTGPRTRPAPAPPESTPVHTVTIDLGTPERGAISRTPDAGQPPVAAATAPPPAAAAATGPAAPGALPATPPPAPVPASGNAAPPAAAVVETSPAASPAPAATGAPASVARHPAAAPTPTPGPAPARAAPAAPTPVAAVAPRPLTHSAEAWVIQLGSFASRENAEHLAQTLHGKGYSAFVTEYRGSGKVLFRVRVGPEQDRARAEAIAARLEHEGYRGSVAPEP